MAIWASGDEDKKSLNHLTYNGKWLEGKEKGQEVYQLHAYNLVMNVSTSNVRLT